METLFNVIAASALTLAALFCLERALAFGLRRLAHVLPDDLAGPDGWLVDTSRGTGIFDPRTPS